MKTNNRRTFLKKCGWSAVPFLLPTVGGVAKPIAESMSETKPSITATVNFLFDGLWFSPRQYLEVLERIDQEQPIQPDFYGNGGVTQELQTTFAELTGKEKAIYLPSGTMANQIAIRLLNGPNTKVIVPENSHVYRDEADAAQSVHGLRLVPVGEGQAYFELDDLKATIDRLNRGEVFRSGLGTVVIENPVRRADGKAVPIATIRAISDYCRANGYRLHLDGARIHLASAFEGVTLKEYASYFDTVYISLYKYLNAAGGAVLCGDEELIRQVEHQIKIHGGTTFQSWSNTAIALHYLKGIEARWKEVLDRTQQLIVRLNEMKGVEVKRLEQGTNIFHLHLAKEINLGKLTNHLYHQHQILFPDTIKGNAIPFHINESLLNLAVPELVSAWTTSIQQAKE